MSLTAALTIDILIVLACAGLLLTRGGASHSHPAVLYILFHVLVVTGRGLAVARGAPTFLSGVPGYEGLRLEEIARAILYADLALAAATLGWLSSVRRRRRVPTGVPPNRAFAWRPLRVRYVYVVGVVALPLGLLAFARFGFVPGVVNGATAGSKSTLVLALTWPGLILIALIYCRGFRPRYLVPLTVYLVVISLQGSGRFRLILPVVLLVQIYLDQRGKRWPNLRLVGVLLAAGLLFFPLKSIGRSVQAGDDAKTIRSSAQRSIGDATSGQNEDQALLDELAMTLSLADESNKTFLGRPYLNVLVLPVPRILWAGKPGLADYLKEISKPSRPLDAVGGVTTLPGDLYLNFRLPGVILISFILARLSARWYEAVYRRPYRSVGRFAFLLLACNLVQVYRDGLISIPFFLLVQMLPLMIVLALHSRVRPRTTETPLTTASVSA